MQEFDSGELEVSEEDSLMLKKLLVERGADRDILGSVVMAAINGTTAQQPR